MRASEWIVAAYLAYFAVLAWTQPLSRRRRTLVTAVTLTDLVVIWQLSTARQDLALVVRDWLPALQILIGYWLSGAFFREPMPRAEAWLAQADRVLFVRFGMRRLARRAPRLLLEYLELAYLMVYPCVPVGFAIVYFSVPAPPVDAYWQIVLTAELTCYAMLPWIQTRPPTLLGLFVSEIEHRGLGMRRLNQHVLRSGSIQVNTIPSGHAAGSLATALAVGMFVPPAFPPLLVLALSIIAASVIGRYHYAADSVLGALVAIAAWVLWS